MYKGTAADGSSERVYIAVMGITCRDVLPFIFSPNPYRSTFEERLEIRQYHMCREEMRGMVFVNRGGHLTLKDIVRSAPAARTHAWHTRIRGVSLWKVWGVGGGAGLV